MRVELADADAEMIRRCIESYKGSDSAPEFSELDRLAGLVTPPERLTAILMPEGVTRHTPDSCWLAECDDCGEPIRRHPDHGWIHAFDTDHSADLGDLVPTCPRCGGQDFGYEEGATEYRWGNGSHPNGYGGGTVAVVWEIGCSGESGDDDPGLFCDNWRGGGCGAPIDLPDGWEVDFQ